jgi:hypothetical protein
MLLDQPERLPDNLICRTQILTRAWLRYGVNTRLSHGAFLSSSSESESERTYRTVKSEGGQWREGWRWWRTTGGGAGGRAGGGATAVLGGGLASAVAAAP